MKVKISQIRIDGGTQSRLSINEAVVADYADAMASGVDLPPVVLFFDGSHHWLADGFHRYHAHNKIGALEIDSDVRNGTKRDAVLFSVGANGAHGLQRTNADKHRSVETLLSDAEWVQWSDREIAKACSVANSFVSKIRTSLFSENSEKPAERTYTTKHGTEAVMKTAKIGKREDVQAAPAQAPKPTAAPIEEEPEDEGPSAEEIAFLEETEVADRAAYNNLVEIATGDDKLAEALALVVTQTHEIARLKALVRTLEESRDGKMNAINEHIRTIKSLRRKIEKLEKVSA